MILFVQVLLVTATLLQFGVESRGLPTGVKGGLEEPRDSIQQLENMVVELQKNFTKMQEEDNKLKRMLLDITGGLEPRSKDDPAQPNHLRVKRDQVPANNSEQASVQPNLPLYASLWPFQGHFARDGKDGVNGRDGRDGNAGLNGRDGRDGQPGLPGPTGPMGATGPQGKPGPPGMTVEEIRTLIRNMTMTPPPQSIEAADCASLYKAGHRESGVYQIYPEMGSPDPQPVGVFCDMETDGGGWTVFQRRLDGSVNFYRGWSDYKNGFGDPHGEYWLGNDIINHLTRQGTKILRINFEDTSGEQTYAQFSMFAVSSEQNKYRLSLGTYSGTAGDSLSEHRGQPFSTKDRDNDAHSGHCAQSYKGAWWYKSCHQSNLNGLYHLGQHSSGADGVNWYHGKGHNYSYKSTAMMIRPAGF